MYIKKKLNKSTNCTVLTEKSGNIIPEMSEETKSTTTHTSHAVPSGPIVTGDELSFSTELAGFYRDHSLTDHEIPDDDKKETHYNCENCKKKKCVHGDKVMPLLGLLFTRTIAQAVILHKISPFLSPDDIHQFYDSMLGIFMGGYSWKDEKLAKSRLLMSVVSDHLVQNHSTFDERLRASLAIHPIYLHHWCRTKRSFCSFTVAPLKIISMIKTSRSPCHFMERRLEVYDRKKSIAKPGNTFSILEQAYLIKKETKTYEYECFTEQAIRNSIHKMEYSHELDEKSKVIVNEFITRVSNSLQAKFPVPDREKKVFNKLCPSGPKANFKSIAALFLLKFGKKNDRANERKAENTPKVRGTAPEIPDDALRQAKLNARAGQKKVEERKRERKQLELRRKREEEKKAKLVKRTLQEDLANAKKKKLEAKTKANVKTKVIPKKKR